MKLNKQDKELLLDILETVRIDSILGENSLDQDEIGLLMAKLGDKSMKDIYFQDGE